MSNSKVSSWHQTIIVIQVTSSTPMSTITSRIAGLIWGWASLSLNKANYFLGRWQRTWPWVTLWPESKLPGQSISAPTSAANLNDFFSTTKRLRILGQEDICTSLSALPECSYSNRKTATSGRWKVKQLANPLKTQLNPGLRNFHFQVPVVKLWGMCAVYWRMI